MQNFTFSRRTLWQQLKVKAIVLFLVSMLAFSATQAQVSSYTFSQSNGTYTPITGGTLIGRATDANPTGNDSAAMDDYTYAATALPFAFNFNGVAYNSIYANTNGWASFVNTSTTSSGVSGTTFAISPFGNDMMGQFAASGSFTTGSNVITAVSNTTTCTIGAAIQGTGIPTGSTITAFDATSITISNPATATSTGTFLTWTTGEIRAETIGSAPNRTFILQFKNMGQYSTSLDATVNNTTVNFQIQLSEGGGVASSQTITIVYGTFLRLATASRTGQTGLRGSSATADFNNRTTTTDWAATTAGSSNSATMTWTTAIYPASGLTYTWAPPVPVAMTYVSATTTQSATTSVPVGSTGQQIIGVQVVVTGTLTPLAVTQLVFNTNGSTKPSDIANAKVYFTGTSSTFATTTQYGSTITAPNGPFTVTGSQVLTGGFANTTNYFWLVYDITCGATAADSVDAECTSVNVGGAQTPTVTAPAGNRPVTGLVTSTFQPSTASATAGAINAQVLRLDIAGSVCLGNITTLNFTNSSTSLADISKARVFYTTSTTFSNAVQFGTDVINPGATFSVTGNQAAATTGTNYFWLVYDLTCAAPSATGNKADASVVSVVTSLAGTLTLATPNPTGDRTIIASTTGDFIQAAPTAVIGGAGNPFDITGKSLQVNEPSPILNTQPSATNGSGSSNYSWGSAAGNSQWYKLEVPTTGTGSSGNFLIRATTAASPNDAQVAVWKFPNMVSGDCSTVPNFTNGYLLAANDDAIATGTGYTVNSTLNSVCRVHLTPGQTYYIEVDGYNTDQPIGTLFIDDLADPAGKNVPNNGLGPIHDPTTTAMLYASYEVIGDDGWTYYYTNSGTSTNIADDSLLMALNWSAETSYLWKGTSATGTSLLSHVRRSATSSSAPSSTAPASATGTDAFVIWSGKVSAPAVSGDLKATAPYVTAPRWFMLNKVWNAFPNVQPTGGSIGIRYFYSDADFAALQTAVTGAGGVLNNKADMKFIKMTKSATTHYTNAEINPAGGQAAIAAGTVTEFVATNTTSVQTGINQAEYYIATFSGGGGGSNGAPLGGPLPIKLVYFQARKTTTGNALTWKVNSTAAKITLVIERSADARSFTQISNIVADQARCLLPFDLNDAQPLKGTNYYRLKMIDIDGAVSYSAVVAIINADKGIEFVGVYPTVVNNSAFLSVAAAKVGKIHTIITDMTGKVIKSTDYSVNEGSSLINIDFSALAAGAYNITGFVDNARTKTIRFVKL